MGLSGGNLGGDWRLLVVGEFCGELGRRLLFVKTFGG